MKYFVFTMMLLLTIAARSDTSHAEPPTLRPEVMSSRTLLASSRETLISLPITVETLKGKVATEFQLTYFRPPGDGPFPIAIVHHGRNEDNSEPSRHRISFASEYFRRRGFAVLVPTRVGYGGLGSKIDPDRGPPVCDVTAARAQIASVLAHTEAALAFARRQPWADPSRVILAGQSVGGYTSVAAAPRVPGVVAVFNFAGGVGARLKNPGKPGCPERVTRVLDEAGKKLRVPTLWVYARNDQAWGPELPKAWHKAFVDSGGNAQFVEIANLPGNGHDAINSGFKHWRRPADALMQKLGFEAPSEPDAPKPTNYAALGDVKRLPTKHPKAAEAYERFLATDLPRAFVIGPSGAWAYRGGMPLALKEALAACQRSAHETCAPYVVDDQVVWVP